MTSKRREGAGSMVVVGLVTLAVVTVVLTFLALKHARPTVPNAGETPGYTAFQSDSGSDPDAAVEEQPDDEQEPLPTPATVPPLSRVLALQDGSVAYRAITGECPGSTAVIETTRDGGETWTPADLGGYGAISSPVRLAAGADGYSWVATQNGDDCASIEVLQSYSFGSEWEIVPDGSSIAWHINPSDAAVLQAPQIGDVAAPCEAARIASTSATAVGLLCADTRVAASLDAGTNWAVSAPFAGAEALAPSDDGYLLAQTDAVGCDGTQVSRISAGLTAEFSTCVAGVSAPGQTALAAAADGTVWLWAGDVIRMSTDAGKTWN